LNDNIFILRHGDDEHENVIIQIVFDQHSHFKALHNFWKAVESPPTPFKVWRCTYVFVNTLSQEWTN